MKVMGEELRDPVPPSQAEAWCSAVQTPPESMSGRGTEAGELCQLGSRVKKDILLRHFFKPAREGLGSACHVSVWVPSPHVSAGEARQLAAHP